MTRQQILDLKIGDKLQDTLDLEPFTGLKARPGAIYGKPRKVLEIFARGFNVKGEAYVCFYTEFGTSGGRMSGSASEGEEMYRLAEGER